MKKILPFLLLVLLMASCQKDPDMGDLSDNYVVHTNYSKGAAFSSYSTFCIPDSIVGIDGQNVSAITTTQAQQLITTFTNEMIARGYTQVFDTDSADLGVQLAYVVNTNYFAGNNNPYWWDYPAYNNWWNGYWGGSWNGWYYPYQIVYSYDTGSLLANVLDLNASRANNKGDVIWTAYMTGLLYGSNEINTTLATSAIVQAFKQTPAFKAN